VATKRTTQVEGTKTKGTKALTRPGRGSAALAAELASVRARGYALDAEEYERNVVCLAAPVVDFEGVVLAAIGISGPKERMEAQMTAFVEAVREAGRELSALLGAQPT